MRGSGKKGGDIGGIIQEVKGNAPGSGGMPLQASAMTFGVNHG